MRAEWMNRLGETLGYDWTPVAVLPDLTVCPGSSPDLSGGVVINL